MKPGRELDALIADKVMGLTAPTRPTKWNDIFDYYPYSTDIAAAWHVVEKLSKNYGIYLNNELISPRDWEVSLWTKEDLDGESYNFNAEGETAPHAICLAALKAMGVQVDSE